MEDVKVLNRPLMKITVNKCDYCHKPILSQIHCERNSYFPYLKYFCCEECLNLYKVETKKRNL